MQNTTCTKLSQISGAVFIGYDIFLGATTENPRYDMIDAIEGVTTFLNNLIDSLGGRRKRSLEDCSWLDTKLDGLIEIADDTSKKSEIVEIAGTITSAEITTCTAEEVANLEEDKALLDAIVCDLKLELGESCTTQATTPGLVSTTVIPGTTEGRTTLRRGTTERITITITTPKPSATGISS